MLAGDTKDIQVVNALIARGADVNAIDFKGRTALMLAARNKDASFSIEYTSILLINGAQIDLVDHEGESALMKAITSDNYEMVSFLCEKGADLNNHSNNLGFNPLLIAVLRRNVKIVELLLTAGADVYRTYPRLCRGHMKNLLLASHLENIWILWDFEYENSWYK